MADRKTGRAKHAAKKTGGARKTEKAREVRDAEAEKQRSQISAVILFAAGILTACLILISGDHLWLFLHNVILGLFGNCAIIWPILLIYISIVTALERRNSRMSGKLVLVVLLIVVFCAAVYIFSVSALSSETFFQELKDLYAKGVEHSGAGLFSGLLGIPMAALLGSIGSKIVILLLLFVLLMILTGTSLVQLFRAVTKPADIVASNLGTARERRSAERGRSTDIDIPLDDEMPLHPVHSPEKPPQKPKKSEKLLKLEKVFSIQEPQQEAAPSEPAHSEPVRRDPPAKPEPVPNAGRSAPSPAAAAVNPAFQPEPVNDGVYHFPPVTMLETTEEISEREIISEIQTNGRRLVETLNSFGVQTSFIGYSHGPAVTRYELQPASGVKISRITNLSDDLSMNLATAGIRIEAPIPGKAAVGIEVPNKKSTVVRMRELVESNSFQSARSCLTVALGRDIAGDIAVADLGKMPHLLIAGATGSGKSVCINSMIVSLLYKSTPEKVRFLMIDPKVVELGIYNGIPQLLVPVVTDPRKAAGALSWAVTEMLKRYKIFAENNVRDLPSYNRIARSKKGGGDGSELQPMPRIVIIIDELADLMMAAPNEVEDSICRLAQMARAAGMHLLIATQRPSVDVITGIIKANIPSRIAFAVSSQVDSRTILDMGGAEKLLGRGDMLFSPVGSQKPTRIQGCFVSDTEIESVVNFVKKTQDADYSDNIAQEIEKNAAADKNSTENSGSGGEDSDPMMSDAIKCVVDAGQASTSLLQRRLRLGYARAGRLIDEMEQIGVVGPHEGSKPRQVLITYQQWLEMNMQSKDAPDADKKN